jgi:L-fuculose-phosphate aldolase
MNAFEGNISVRVGDLVFETPSTTSKELLTADQIVVVDMDGVLVEGDRAGLGLRPTSETALHLACYRARPDVAAVVHAHAAHCTAVAQQAVDFTDDASAEMQVLFGGRIRCAAYGRQGTDAIAADVGRVLAAGDIGLLAHHGVFAVGPTALAAYSLITSAEGLIRAKAIRRGLYGDAACDGSCDIDAAELDALRAMGGH